MMKKSILLTTIILNSISNSLAYHDTTGGGGPSLPIHETAADNMLYLLLPIFAYTYVINEILQALLDRKYRDNSLKDSSDLMSFTVAASLAATFMLMFTRAFQELAHLDTGIYVAVIGGLLAAGTGLNQREKIFEAIEDFR